MANVREAVEVDLESLDPGEREELLSKEILTGSVEVEIG